MLFAVDCNKGVAMMEGRAFFTTMTNLLLLINYVSIGGLHHKPLIDGELGRKRFSAGMLRLSTNCDWCKFRFGPPSFRHPIANIQCLGRLGKYISLDTVI